MSSKLASLKVKITANGAQATKELERFENKAKNVAKSMKKIGSTLTKYVTGPLVALAAVSVKTADTQMQAEAKLLNALKGREDVQKRLMAQAAELQGRSLFGDEEIINQQAVLAAMGRTEQQINDIIEASAQLSAATGMSLDSAVKNLAKTYGGLAGELGESIPALRTLTKEQLQNGDAVKLVKEQYKGFAEAAAQTGAGPLVQLKNQLGDLSEQIGVILMPFVQYLVNGLSKLVGWLQNLSPAAQKTIVVIAGIAAVVGPLIVSLGLMAQGWAAIVAMAPAISAAFTAMTGPIGAVISAVATLIAMLYTSLTLRDRLQREQNQNRTADQAERRSIIVSNANKEAAGLTDKQLEQAIADTAREWADLKKAIGDKPSQYQADALNGLHWRREALSDELTRRKELAQLLKTTGGYSGGGGSTNAQIEAATGLIGQLQARVQALNKELGNATTEEDIARINDELKKTQEEITRLQNLKPIAISQPMGLSADGLAQGFNQPKFKDSLSNTYKLWAQFNNNIQGESQRTKNITDAFNQAISTSIIGTMTSLAESLGNLLSGAEGMENPLAGILNVLGNALKQLGVALITYSGIVEKVKVALKALWGAGPGGIAAAMAIGTGAIALGQVMISQAGKLPKLAKGGLAYGPTIAMVGDNPGAASDPEVIAPLSKLRSYMGGQRLQLVGNVAFELHGDVARAVLNRENARIIALG